MATMTKAMRAREALKAEYLSNEADCGRFGRAFELDCARAGSKKNRVGLNGEIDVYIRVMRNGKAYNVPAECKTNGGRCDSLLSGENSAQFVIYRLEFTQKHKACIKKGKEIEAWEEERKTPALVIPTCVFLSKLREFNAIKDVNKGGMWDGQAIQPSSKKLYMWLTEYATNFPELIFDRSAIIQMEELDTVLLRYSN